jgi:CRP-like cAMP-binding protein
VKLTTGTFLASLGERERDELAELGIMRKFPRGSMLMLDREPGQRVVILISGRVKVGRTDEEGRELLLDIGDPGDVLGELAFIDGGPRMATVTALEPVDAVMIGPDALRSYLGRHPDVGQVLSEVMSRRLREAQTKRSQFTSLDTMGRLAARLVELAERYGRATGAGIELHVPLSQEELAAWTGASRAGFSKALQGLRDLGWITLARHELTIRDLDALRDLCGRSIPASTRH